MQFQAGSTESPTQPASKIRGAEERSNPKSAGQSSPAAPGYGADYQTASIWRGLIAGSSGAFRPCQEAAAATSVQSASLLESSGDGGSHRRCIAVDILRRAARPSASRNAHNTLPEDHG